MKDDKLSNSDNNDIYTVNDESLETDTSTFDDETVEGAITGGSTNSDVTSLNSDDNSSIKRDISDSKSDVEKPDADAATEGSANDQKDSITDGASDKEKSDIGSDIIRGHINTIILRALYERDKYGYEIMSDIEHKSHGQYSLKQPTLYSALKRLENQGYIRAYWKTDEVSNGGRRKYFTLTESGKEITEKNLAEWEYSRTIIDSLISDKSYDFSQPAPTPVDFTILRNSVSRVPVIKSDERDRNERAYEEEQSLSDGTKFDGEQALSVNENNTSQAVPNDETLKIAVEQINEEIDSNKFNGAQVANEQAITTQAENNSDKEQAIDREALESLFEQFLKDYQNKQQQETDDAPQLAQLQDITPQPEQQQSQTSELNSEELALAESRRIAHENYLKLISEPVRVQQEHHEDIVPGSENVKADSLIYNNRPETERDYKNLIDGIFRKAVSNGSVQYARVEPTRPTPEIKHVRIIDKGRADGVKVATSNNFDSESTYATKTTYDKGKTFLKCSAVVLAIIVVEFVFCSIFLSQLNTTWLYPITILALGIIQFAVFGILAIQGYGKNCVRPTTHSYISSCVILTVIGILIISALAFLLNVNPTLASDVVKMIVIPSITALNVVVFAVCFKAFIK